MTFAVSIAATTTTASVPVAAPAAGKFQCQIMSLDMQTQIAVLQEDKPQFTFKGVASNKYGVRIVRLDVNGSEILISVLTGTFDTGPDASSPPSVPDTVLIDVPTSISVACTQE